MADARIVRVEDGIKNNNVKEYLWNNWDNIEYGFAAKFASLIISIPIIAADC